MVNPAHYTCSKLLDAIKSSQLDFLLQETPCSVFLTIRKKYIKSFKPASAARRSYLGMKVAILEKRLENVILL